MENKRYSGKTSQKEIDEFPILVENNYYPEKLDEEAKEKKVLFLLGAIVFIFLCIVCVMTPTEDISSKLIVGIILFFAALGCANLFAKRNAKLIADLRMSKLKRKAKKDASAKRELDICEKQIVDRKRSEEERKVETTNNLHNMIYKSSFRKFNDGHYADAVESAFKEINSRLKKLYKERRGIELDGEALFSACFNKNDTSFLKVSDLSTQSGKNEQEGFKNHLIGSWQSQRNPKAHENLEITKEEALESLNTASSIMKKIDKAITMMHE